MNIVFMCCVIMIDFQIIITTCLLIYLVFIDVCKLSSHFCTNDGVFLYHPNIGMSWMTPKWFRVAQNCVNIMVITKRG